MNIPSFLKKLPLAVDFEAELKTKVWLNNSIVKLIFEPKNMDFKFLAGQFVNLKFTDSVSEEVLQRAYSIASAPTKNDRQEFELCVEIVPNGKAGNYFSNLQVGDVSKFKGPFGFCTLPSEAKNLLMVATGTGIAPIKSILEQIQLGESKVTDVTVLFGCRVFEDFFYLDELKKIADKISKNQINIKMWLCMSREVENIQADGFESYYGRVTNCLKDGRIEFRMNTHLYICGGSEMIKEVREIGLTNLIDKCNIHVEIFD